MPHYSRFSQTYGIIWENTQVGNRTPPIHWVHYLIGCSTQISQSPDGVCRMYPTPKKERSLKCIYRSSNTYRVADALTLSKNLVKRDSDILNGQMNKQCSELKKAPMLSLSTGIPNNTAQGNLNLIPPV